MVRHGRLSRFVVWMQATACEDEPFTTGLGLEERSTTEGRPVFAPAKPALPPSMVVATRFRIWLRFVATVPAVATVKIER